MSLSLDKYCKLRSTFLSKSYFSLVIFTAFSVHRYSGIIEDSATDHLICCSLIPLSLKSIIWTGSSPYSFCTLHGNLLEIIMPTHFSTQVVYISHCFPKKYKPSCLWTLTFAKHRRRKHNLLIIFNHQIQTELGAKFFL